MPIRYQSAPNFKWNRRGTGMPVRYVWLNLITLWYKDRRSAYMWIPSPGAYLFILAKKHNIQNYKCFSKKELLLHCFVIS
jgi:hypothetical protein